MEQIQIERTANEAQLLFFMSKEDYLAFKKHWSTLFNDRDAYGNLEQPLSGSHHLLYAILRGRDLSKAFVIGGEGWNKAKALLMSNLTYHFGHFERKAPTEPQREYLKQAIASAEKSE